MPTHTLKISSACLLDDANRILVVRKRGADLFILPGGKIEQNETALEALLRELQEEINVTLDSGQLAYLGRFQAQAANEPDHSVIAEIFIGRLTQPIEVQAEIETSGWTDLDSHNPEMLAPLLNEQVIPALRNFLR